MTDENKTDQLISAWERFKQINDARLRDLQQRGSADPLYDEHLHQIGQAIDHQKARLNRTADDSSPYSQAFQRYLRKGMDAGLQAQQLLSVGSDPDGGYLVTPRMSAQIRRAIHETSPLRQLAAVATITSESLELIDDATQGEWSAESVSECSASSPNKRSIPTHELYAQPKATQKLVDDAALDVEAWLSEKIADIFARKESTAFISGTGVGQPRGILTFAAGTGWGHVQQIGSGLNAQVTADGLASLLYSLKDKYTKRAAFLMNRSVGQSVRQLKQADQYLWQPGLAAGAPDTLMGIPVSTASDMPMAANHSLSVALGDFRAGYQVVDRQGIRILRDPFTEKPFVKFYTTVRVGGDVVDFDAIKLLRLAA